MPGRFEQITKLCWFDFKLIFFEGNFNLILNYRRYFFTA